MRIIHRVSSMEIEVLNVSKATDGFSNEDVATVQFGRIVPKSDSKYNMLVSRGMNPSFTTLVLFYKFEDVAPYRVGSKWDLQVDNDGSIKLEEIRK